jgi:hypothetical protein
VNNNKLDIMGHHLLKVKMQRQHIRKDGISAKTAHPQRVISTKTASPQRQYIRKDSMATGTVPLAAFPGQLSPPSTLS